MAVNLSFLDRSPCVFIQVGPQLSSRGSVDSIPDPLLLRESDSAGNRTWMPLYSTKNSQLFLF
jgi:hypothetical protein